MRVSAGSSSRYAAILSSGEQRTVVYAITTRIQIKKTEYDIFFRIVKEQPTHSTRNDARADSSEFARASSLGFCHRPPCAEVVEVNGIEPMTPCLQSRCSPS